MHSGSCVSILVVSCGALGSCVSGTLACIMDSVSCFCFISVVCCVIFSSLLG